MPILKKKDLKNSLLKDNKYLNARHAFESALFVIEYLFREAYSQKLSASLGFLVTASISCYIVFVYAVTVIIYFVSVWVTKVNK